MLFYVEYKHDNLEVFITYIIMANLLGEKVTSNTVCNTKYQGLFTK